MSQKIFRLFLCLCLALTITTAISAQESAKPRNIIMMIGDGMGIAHITATEFEHRELNLRRFKKLGLQTTTSASDFVTDSAAAGTVLATGVKTKNGAIGQDVDGNPLKNVVEYAEEAGKKTGLVVTSSINHATPAAFSTHVESRHHYNDIIEQQVNSDIDVMIGGGFSNLIPQFMPGSRRKDDKNLLFALRRKMPVIQTIEGFRHLGTPDQLAAILDYSHLPRASKRDYTLGELTSKAIEILDQGDNGFFLMIEGSQIDLAAHKNDYAEILSETLDFDTAIKAAMDFAERDGNTLLIVTADHETGGLTLTGGDLTTKKVKPHFASDYHSAGMVGVFSYGPGSDNFIGIFDNTHIGKTLIELVK
jgi:alkaline phosphatase